VGTNLWIQDNASLVSLSGLSNLTSLDGDLDISDNGILPNLDGLNNLTQVGTNLWIQDNAALTNLNGLAALTTVGGWVLWINYNDSLPDCEVCELLAQLSSIPSSLNVQNNLDDTCTPVPDSCP
jgi:hypothetical protein